MAIFGIVWILCGVVFILCGFLWIWIEAQR
jgi:hypothetical protein